MLKKYKWIILIIAVLSLAAILAFFGQKENRNGKKSNKSKKIRLIETQMVDTQTMSKTINLTGKVVVTNSVTLTAMVDGLISFCPWREGDQVKKNEFLIKIKRPLFIAEMEVKQASLDVAEAKLADLKSGNRPEEIRRAQEIVKSFEEKALYTAKDLERNKKLGMKSIVSAESIELSKVTHAKCSSDLAAVREQLKILKAGATKTEIGILEAEVKEAAALLKVANAKVAECELRAPFDGIITKILVRQGDLARTKESLLKLIEPASIVVRFNVPEQYAHFLVKGGALQILLDACCDKYINSEISRIFPEVNERTHTVTVEAKLSTNGRFLPGMFARIRLPIKTVKQAIVVPLSAVLTTPQGKQIIYTVVDGKAVKKSIQTGLENAKLIQICSGISLGENVITAGNEALKDGIAVKVRKPKKPQIPGKSALKNP